MNGPLSICINCWWTTLNSNSPSYLDKILDYSFQGMGGEMSLRNIRTAWEKVADRESRSWSCCQVPWKWQHGYKRWQLAWTIQMKWCSSSISQCQLECLLLRRRKRSVSSSLETVLSKLRFVPVFLIISFLNSGHFKFQNTCSFKRDYQTLVYVYMNENHQRRVTEKLFVNCSSVHFLLRLINTDMKMILTWV